MKLQSIEMGNSYPHGYGDGAKPAISCKVTLQTGERSYEKTDFNLSPEAVKRVVKAALAEVQAMLVVEDDFDVEGAPGAPKPEPVAEVVSTKDALL